MLEDPADVGSIRRCDVMILEQWSEGEASAVGRTTAVVSVEDRTWWRFINHFDERRGSGPRRDFGLTQWSRLGG